MSTPHGAARSTPSPDQPPDAAADTTQERTLGQLVSDASRDLSGIVRAEVALAKAEVKRSITAAVVGAALFVVAGTFAFLALILLLIAAAYGLVAAGLSPWLAFLVVAGALLLLTLLLILIGKSRLGRLGAPERTIRSARLTLDSVKSAGSPS